MFIKNFYFKKDDDDDSIKFLIRKDMYFCSIDVNLIWSEKGNKKGSRLTILMTFTKKFRF